MGNASLVTARKVLCLDESGTVATWLVIEDGRIAALGTGEPPSAAQAIPLEGVVLPGLIDAHVHLTATGLYRSGLDLREAHSVDEVLAAIREHMKESRTAWILAGNYDPGAGLDHPMPDRRDLDSVAQFRAVFVSRIDGHSCSLSSAGLAKIDLDPSLPGIDLDLRGRPSGVLTGPANYEARRRVFAHLPDEQIRLAQLAACRMALERGVTAVHEMAGERFAGDRDLEVLLASRESYPIHVRPYLATFDVERAGERGLDCVGGDLFLDGSIGSATAAMKEPYLDGPSRGSLYHPDEEITSFFLRACRMGLQAGVHAIGDAAVEQAILCLERAFSQLDPEEAAAARRRRMRIEHFECVSEEQLERASRLGVVASVQPAFDRLWGGPQGMYAARLGERALAMNPFRMMLAHGLVLAGGSDSPVTLLDPFGAMAAAAGHHVPGFSVSVDDALRMFTLGGALAAHEEWERGSLEVGKRADLCVVSEDPTAGEAADLAGIQVLETWVGGKRVWSASGGSAPTEAGEEAEPGFRWSRERELPPRLF